MPEKLIITHDGTDIARVQLNDLPARLMRREDLNRLLVKLAEVGGIVESRSALGTIITEYPPPTKP